MEHQLQPALGLLNLLLWQMLRNTPRTNSLLEYLCTWGIRFGIREKLLLDSSFPTDELCKRRQTLHPHGPHSAYLKTVLSALGMKAATGKTRNQPAQSALKETQLLPLPLLRCWWWWQPPKSCSNTLSHFRMFSVTSGNNKKLCVGTALRSNQLAPLRKQTCYFT